jgi:hypothetical protein
MPKALLLVRFRLQYVTPIQIEMRINPVTKNKIVFIGSGISKDLEIGSGLINKNIRMIAQNPQT